jgi:broad specificity phosphatase PhoE
MANNRRRLVVLRHGETEHNADGRWQGQLDTSLSERGHAQARAVAQALVASRPTRVVASDLQRAARTAQVVAQASAVPVTLDERLREIHVGAWAGLTTQEVKERYPEDQDRLISGVDFARGGHGESVADVADRVREALDDLLAALGPDECVVIATHGVTGRVIVAELTGLDQHLAWTVLAGLGNCHWAEVREAAHGWRLQAWNVSAADAR